MQFQKSFAKSLVESSGILFAALLIFAAIAYAALSNWSPGEAPSAGPGSGNVKSYFLIETRTSDPVGPEDGRIWLRSDL